MKLDCNLVLRVFSYVPYLGAWFVSLLPLGLYSEWVKAVTVVLMAEGRFLLVLKLDMFIAQFRQLLVSGFVL